MFEPIDPQPTEGHVMFQELYAVARHTPLSILVTPNGEQLSVIVTPKPSGDAADNPALAHPIKAVGTPAELDAELPGKLREYTNKVNELRSTIELPIDALSEAQAKAKKSQKAKAASTPKPAAPAKKPTKPAKAKPVRKAAAKPAAAKKKIVLPGAARSAKKRAPVPRSSLPGKPACIEDYTKLSAKHGDALTRRKFIKEASTARRYEKLWKNWEAFIAEAQSTKSAAPSAPAAATQPAQGSSTPSPQVANEHAGATAAAETHWPYPTR